LKKKRRRFLTPRPGKKALLSSMREGGRLEYQLVEGKEGKEGEKKKSRPPTVLPETVAELFLAKKRKKRKTAKARKEGKERTTLPLMLIRRKEGGWRCFSEEKISFFKKNSLEKKKEKGLPFPVRLWLRR